MTTANITYFHDERAAGVTFFHAPSLSSAIRADSEILASLMRENGLVESMGALCTYTAGAVTCDGFKAGPKYIFEFVKDGESLPFARVVVH